MVCVALYRVTLSFLIISLSRWGGKAGEAYDQCYHKDCDGIDNLNKKAWIQNTRAAAHSIATYARSLNGISRAPRPSSQGARVANLSHDQRRHQGCGHEVPTI